MPKIPDFGAAGVWPEAFVSNTAISRRVSRAVKAGKLRRLASRLYTRNLVDPPEVVVKRNVWDIVAGYFPGALVADRTALEAVPAADGSVCLISNSGRNVMLPGHVLRPRRGAMRLETDSPFMGGLFFSSTARAYVENMRPSRARGGLVARTLSRGEIEERLDALIRRSGEDAAKRLRDEIRVVGETLGMVAEAAELDRLIGSLLGTATDVLSTPTAKARQAGRPYDPLRIGLFQDLHAALRNYQTWTRVAPQRDAGSRETLNFFEAYFSNFIEGTEFTVEEAVEIVFEGRIPNERPEDAHDVLGTWRVVSDSERMNRTPESADDLLRLLEERHAVIMEGRPEAGPGRFKSRNNRAGVTEFVAPELVVGTLERGFELYRSLREPFQRAVFMKFLVSEVHPFADGNGRTARIMMNAELAAAGEQRIIVPTILRADYLVALKALSQGTRADALIRVLDKAQQWSFAVNWTSVEEAESELEACNAFLDSMTADREGLRLEMPEGSFSP